MIFISAPFGNFLQFDDAISVTGTFTLKPRSGRFKQIVKTLRYVPTKSGWAWRNALGLRNPGIVEGLTKHKLHNVLSIASLENDDWQKLYDLIPKNTNIELNISCPNVDDHPDLNKEWLNNNREWCIVKVPPTISRKQIDDLVDLGYEQIHASNTLQTPKGGLSGKILQTYTRNIILYLSRIHPHVQIIAGGGVTSSKDVQNYIEAGADHISLGSVCFTPWKIKGIINQ